MTETQCNFGLWYDFRNPPQWRQSFTDLYRETLEQIQWAEGLGLDSVWLTEHHFCDDGYSPSPFPMAAAIGARTSTMRIGTNLIIAPLHDPIRLAEDAATVSLLTGGRFDLGLGQGYSEREFSAFGRNLRNRPSLLEESVALIRRAWSESTEPFQGKRFQFPDLSVTPKPEQTPRLLIGGLADAAIDRAARIADGFLSSHDMYQPVYLEALKKQGKSIDDAQIFSGQYTIIADDPEREWARIGKHALYQLNEYISWGAFGPVETTPEFEDADQIIAAGAYRLWDTATAIDRLTELLTDRPQLRDIHFWTRLPGESIDTSSARLELLATKVVPAVRERLASSSQ